MKVPAAKGFAENMKWLSFFLTIIFLFLPFAFCIAQEVDANAAETGFAGLPDENAVETADVPESARTEGFLPSVIIGEDIKDSLNFIERFAIAVAIIIAQILLIMLLWYLFKRLNAKLEHTKKNRIKPFVIKKFTVFSTKMIVGMIEFFLRIVKYLITALMLFLTLPIVFSLFPATREFSSRLFSYLLNPIKDIAMGALLYIPNLIRITIAVIVMRYVLKGIKYFAKRIEKGKITIPHFYPDWAAPTFRILQVFLWAFTIALIFPYLPGSDTRAFQGVSVFLGIIFSIGSTSAIGNLVAGFVITYMRPFKIGDNVKINDITGVIVEKNLMVVRLKTYKNEYVTFPNLTILNSSTTNYNTSSNEGEEGLIIHAEVTFGYSTPWQTVHDILINAALATDNILKTPKPFVLQTKLDDFYACYQINCYTKDISKVPETNTMLYENIQEGFRSAGLDMTSAHYNIIVSDKE